MSSPFHIRDARKDEISSLAHLSSRAFRGRPLNVALFPEHLQTHPDEEHDFRVARLLLRFDDENMHYIVVADKYDSAVGYAVWQSPPKLEPDPEEVEAAKVKARAICPKGMDIDALAKIEMAIEVLGKYLKDALGEEKYKKAWYLDGLSVDPAHQRKGIGKMLMQWGHDRADEEHKNVRLMATEKGAKLYRSLGYEEVGSLEVFGAIEYAFIRKAF